MPNPIKAIKAAKKAIAKKTVIKTKQPVPTKVKVGDRYASPNTYNVKKTLTGKLKLTNTRTKKSVTISKKNGLTSENINRAEFSKIQKQINRKQNAKIYGGGTAIGAAIGIPLGNAIVKKRRSK